ncbi:endo-beta-N-acetylglucosaminidase [Flavobacterium sp.]|uniref:endo-beta-N-acetylglucosaminidase n=1 Tax=Flavobacterium sp. TaxID=239 RepID=UPI0039E32998
MKKITLLSLLFCGSAFSQIINTAPYILTVNELKAWTANGPTASNDLIATEPLATRFTNTATQFNPALSNDMQIAYLPDGMNNFGNYYGEQSQFNLYNFTHWAYIDKLIWFGGTSSQTIQLPSSPWTNAAHKNGVKVYGNVFFAPTAFGGSTATLQNFLEVDGSGNFIAIPKMVEMMQHYQFDGWFINQETATNSTVAGQMHDFLRDLTTAVEAVGKEVMWYDAMILSGSVGWQNRLNSNNSPFVQDDQDADGTFETRVSSSIFINFFWSAAAVPNVSRNRAIAIGRSPYEVFTGADIWPDRNQGNFELNGNTFMTNLHNASVGAVTSLGLFATNCIYNSSVFSNFNNDPSDVDAFYNAEKRMFAGMDGNPAIVDATGWKGFANWVPETTVITDPEFRTDFCTGHGNKKFIHGQQTGSSPWHNMNEQDILPTWQWAFTPNSGLNATWDFEDAYNGGNSLKVSGNLTANAPVDLMLFKTKIPMTFDMGVVSNMMIHYKETNQLQVNMKLLLVFSDEPSQKYELTINETGDVWVNGDTDTSNFQNRELAVIGLRFESDADVVGYSVNIGQLDLVTTILGTDHPDAVSHFVTVSYPDSDRIDFTLNWPNAQQVNYTVYDLQGRKVKTDAIGLNQKTTYAFDANGLSSGTYVVKFVDQNNTVVTKKIVVK